MRLAHPFNLGARRFIRSSMFLLPLLVTGCVVGPDYRPPDSPPPKAYSSENATIGGQSEEASVPKQVFVRAAKVRSDWYRVFGSDKLDSLIRQAIQNSPSLAASKARLKAAREVVRENKGALYPQVGVGADVSRKRTNGAQSGTLDSDQTNTFNLYQGQATASYDLDLFGKTRREIEKSSALFDKQRYQVLDTYVTLINNVVVTAITEAGLNTTIKAIQRLIKSQKSALGIVRQQILNGAAIEADATQLETQLARSRASLEPLRKQKEIAINRLAVLVGTTPGEFKDPGFTLDELQLPSELPVSVPSQLVRNRPDILEAIAIMHAANAQIGIASANLWPDLRISGSYGRAGLSPADLGGPTAILYSLGVSLTAPIFEGGRLRAAERQAKDLHAAAVSDYRTTLLAAFADVANSLRAIESDARTLQSRQHALDAARTNLNTVRAQLKNGVVDQESMYLAQSQFQSTKLDCIKARITRYRDTAELFHALGGGWQNEGTTSVSTPNHELKVTTTSSE